MGAITVKRVSQGSLRMLATARTGSTCRAKIVCTTGPVTDPSEQIQALVDVGMDVARINRPHGKPEEHEAVIQKVRKVVTTSGRTIAVLVDLQGLRIRLEIFGEGPQALKVGDTLIITTRTVPGTKELVGMIFKGLPGDCAPGDRLFIDDDNVVVRVVEVIETDAVTWVEASGVVLDHKGLNLPGVVVSVLVLSEKDKGDLRRGLKQDVDFIAPSLVCSARGINDAHAIMDEVGRRIPATAKIEKPQAVEALPETVDTLDGIMVIRGDLGMEISLKSVPLVQKRATELARRAAEPVIVAT